MRQGQRRAAVTLMLALAAIVAALAPAGPARAHQPWFEDDDFTSAAPFVVDDPDISTAVYATLEAPDDVDYFVFDVEQAGEVLLEITIPQIEGQQTFAPSMALLGWGFSPAAAAADLPAALPTALRRGGVLLLPPPEQATAFFEPFSRTAYWERQSQRVALPGPGRYTVVVWSPEQRVGRYTFVVGTREVPGGDPAFRSQITSYWTPVPTPEPALPAVPSAEASPAAAPSASTRDGGRHRCGE